MKIAIISTNTITCPPTNPATGKSCYAGIEQLTYQQAVGLYNRGHKVLLVAPHGSKVPDGIEHHPTTLGELEQLSYKFYEEKLKDVDVICDSSWNKWTVIGRKESKIKAPSLLFVHCPVDTQYNVAPPIPKPCFVAISKDMAKHIKEYLGCEAKVCYNGVDVQDYKPTDRKRNNRYLFLARFSTIKGPDIACDIAKKCKVMLDLIGDDRITAEPQFLQEIKNQCSLSQYLRFIGPQTREQCASWFNSNKALLHPNKRYREPFGLSPVEAQLSGMPVIAWKYGAMPETIKHGETGFLVNSEEEMEELIKIDAVSTIKPGRCREWAMQFSYEKMIDRVEELCKEAISTGGW